MGPMIISSRLWVELSFLVNVIYIWQMDLNLSLRSQVFYKFIYFLFKALPCRFRGYLPSVITGDTQTVPTSPDLPRVRLATTEKSIIPRIGPSQPIDSVALKPWLGHESHCTKGPNIFGHPHSHPSQGPDNLKKFMCFCLVIQLCPTLCDPLDYIPPDSSIHGNFQARILERVAISSSRGSSRPWDQTRSSALQVVSFTEPLVKSSQEMHRPS